ncbi:MAG: DoxX family membrane protein [Chloroflexi bacterium]|nr:DoxX family membrane protein [Chloroflexota bacterium]
MSDTAGILLLVGRVLFAAFFAFSAMGHLMRSPMMVQYARSKKVPLAPLGGWPAGVALAAGSLSVVLGLWPDLGALLLGLLATIFAPTVHKFWAEKDPMARMNEQMSFIRNVALLGAAIALFTVFAWLGDGLRFAITAPLIRF